MSDRRTEQGEDAIASRLHDVAVVAMGGVDHQFEGRIDEGACLLGIEVLHQIHRTLDVGEQRGNGLALAFEIFIAGVSATRIGASSISLPTAVEFPPSAQRIRHRTSAGIVRGTA